MVRGLRRRGGGGPDNMGAGARDDCDANRSTIQSVHNATPVHSRVLHLVAVQVYKCAVRVDAAYHGTCRVADGNPSLRGAYLEPLRRQNAPIGLHHAHDVSSGVHHAAIGQHLP